jgi:hypothetical protein
VTLSLMAAMTSILAADEDNPALLIAERVAR